MINKRFNIGDRVIPLEGIFEGIYTSSPGTIIYVSYSNNTRVGVEFDERIPEGHSCEGRGTDGHCRYGHVNELDIFLEEERPREFFYKSRTLSIFLSKYKQA